MRSNCSGFEAIRYLGVEFAFTMSWEIGAVNRKEFSPTHRVWSLAKVVSR